MRTPWSWFPTDLSSRLGQWLPRSAHGLTVLSMDGRWLKLLHVTGAGRRVTTLMAHPVEGTSDEGILNLLRQACAAKGFEPGPVLIANPSHLTTTRLFTLPATHPKEIRDIVELQAEKHTPYAKEEILADFRIIDTDRAGYSRVLLALSHQDIVHRALKLVEGMGWLLDRVGFELEGLVSWFGVVQRDVREGAMVVELDSEITTLVVLQHHKPYFHRSLGLGVRHLFDDPKEAPVRLAAELQRSLDAFEAEGLNVPVSTIVLTGQATRFPGLQELVQKHLELPTTVVLPFEGCPVAEGAKTPDDAVDQVSFAGLLGLAIGPSEIDLTPKALKLHRAFEARAKALMGLGVQAIAALLLLSCLIVGKAYQNERYHARLLREQELVAAQAQELEETLGRLEFVKSWLRRRGQVLEVVSEVNQRTPSAILWDSFTFTAGEGVVLKGVSDEIPTVYDFAAELKRSPLFARVDARRVTKKTVNERDVTEFELVCPLASEEATHGEAASPGG